MEHEINSLPIQATSIWTTCPNLTPQLFKKLKKYCGVNAKSESRRVVVVSHSRLRKAVWLLWGTWVCDWKGTNNQSSENDKSRYSRRGRVMGYLRWHTEIESVKHSQKEDHKQTGKTVTPAEVVGYWLKNCSFIGDKIKWKILSIVDCTKAISKLGKLRKKLSIWMVLI